MYRDRRIVLDHDEQLMNVAMNKRPQKSTMKLIWSGDDTVVVVVQYNIVFSLMIFLMIIIMVVMVDISSTYYCFLVLEQR